MIGRLGRLCDKLEEQREWAALSDGAEARNKPELRSRNDLRLPIGVRSCHLVRPGIHDVLTVRIFSRRRWKRWAVAAGRL